MGRPKKIKYEDKIGVIDKELQKRKNRSANNRNGKDFEEWQIRW